MPKGKHHQENEEDVEEEEEKPQKKEKPKEKKKKDKQLPQKKKKQSSEDESEEEEKNIPKKHKKEKEKESDGEEDEDEDEDEDENEKKKKVKNKEKVNKHKKDDSEDEGHKNLKKKKKPQKQKDEESESESEDEKPKKKKVKAHKPKKYESEDEQVSTDEKGKKPMNDESDEEEADIKIAKKKDAKNKKHKHSDDEEDDQKQKHKKNHKDAEKSNDSDENSDSNSEKDKKKNKKDATKERKVHKSIKEFSKSIAESFKPKKDIALASAFTFFHNIMQADVSILSSVVSLTGIYGYTEYKILKEDKSDGFAYVICILFYLSFSNNSRIRSLMKKIEKGDIDSSNQYPYIDSLNEPTLTDILSTPIEDIYKIKNSILDALTKYVITEKESIALKEHTKLSEFVTDIATILELKINYCEKNGTCEWKSILGGIKNGDATLVFDNFNGINEKSDITIFIFFNKCQYISPRPTKSKKVQLCLISQNMDEKTINDFFCPNSSSDIGAADKKYLSDIDFTLDLYHQEKNQLLQQLESGIVKQEPIQIYNQKYDQQNSDATVKIGQPNLPPFQLHNKIRNVV